MKYKLRKNAKVTMWLVEHFKVEANNLEEAIDKLKEGKNVSCVEESEWDFDSWSPTGEFEIYDDGNNLIYETTKQNFNQ